MRSVRPPRWLDFCKTTSMARRGVAQLRLTVESCQSEHSCAKTAREDPLPEAVFRFHPALLLCERAAPSALFDHFFNLKESNDGVRDETPDFLTCPSV